jgi:hypothetical protein
MQLEFSFGFRLHQHGEFFQFGDDRTVLDALNARQLFRRCLKKIGNRAGAHLLPSSLKQNSVKNYGQNRKNLVFRGFLWS